MAEVESNSKQPSASEEEKPQESPKQSYAEMERGKTYGDLQKQKAGLNSRLPDWKVKTRG